MNVSRLALRWGLLLSVTAGILFHSASAIAAQRVVLKYRIFRRSVSVEELTTLAETGEASPALQTYLRMAGKQPEEVRQVLTQEVQVNPVTLDRILNSAVGNVVLNQVNQAIYTPSRQADRQAMRSALTLSASEDSKISLIEVLQNYPTEEVHVDGDRLVQTYNQLQRLEGRLSDLIQGIF